MKKKYLIEIPNAQEVIEASQSLGSDFKDRITDLNLSKVSINNQGSFVALTFQITVRENKRLKSSFLVLYCPDISKGSDFEQRQEKPSHQRQGSVVKDVFSGVTGYMSSRIKPSQDTVHQKKRGHQIYPSNAYAEQPSEFAQPIILQVNWRNDLPLILSSLDNYEIKKGAATFGPLESLIRVNSDIQLNFCEITDKISLSSQKVQESLRISAVHLVQQNFEKDLYYLEVQNLEVKSTALSKQNIEQPEVEISTCCKGLFTRLDYEIDYDLISLSDQIIARNSPGDRHNNMMFVALNSNYIFYTKLFFVKYDESQISLQLDLYSMISANEQPPTNPVTGKAQLLIDDAQWTSDCQFVIIILRGASLGGQDQQQETSMPGTLCILPRLGTSFIRVMNPTRFNISRQITQPSHHASRSAIGSSLAAKDDIMFKPQKFMQLFMSDIVSQKLKSRSSHLRYAKKWQISLKSATIPDSEPHESLYQLFLNNGGEQIYEFEMKYPSIEACQLENIERMFGIGKVLEEEKGGENSQHQRKMEEKVAERNQLGFLRYTMTQQEVSSSPELLLKLPDLLVQQVPLYQYDRIEERYNKDIKEMQEARRLAKEQIEKKKLTTIKSDASEEKKAIKESLKASGFQGKSIGNGAISGNHENLYEILNQKMEQYEPSKVVASIQKLFTFCRWAEMSGGSSSASELQPQGLLSLNFKQWLITIVNDSFFFTLNRGEPLLALQILKIAESYFGAKNDPSDYYIQKHVGKKDEEAVLYIEVNQVLLDDPKTFDSIAQSVRDPQSEMFAQSSIDHNTRVEQNMIQDILPIQLPLNLTQPEQSPQNFLPSLNSDSRPSTTNFQFLSLKNLFQNHYTHLIFYCMIQFRNYQAASFNILFLVIANFISQRQMDPTFLRHYKVTLSTLVQNYLGRVKTGEHEMFLGSQEKQNLMKDPLMLTLESFRKFWSLERRHYCLQNSEHRDLESETVLQRTLSAKSLEKSLASFLGQEEQEAQQVIRDNRICNNSFVGLFERPPGQLLESLRTVVFEPHARFLEAYSQSKKRKLAQKEPAEVLPGAINFYQKEDSFVEEATGVVDAIKVGEDVDKTKNWNASISFQGELCLAEILASNASGNGTRLELPSLLGLLRQNLSRFVDIPHCIARQQTCLYEYGESSIKWRYLDDFQRALSRSREGSHELRQSLQAMFYGQDGIEPSKAVALLKAKSNQFSCLGRLDVDPSFTATLACQHLESQLFVRDFLSFLARQRENELFATEYASWMSAVKADCKAQKMEHKYLLRVLDALSLTFNLFMNARSPDEFLAEYVKRRQKAVSSARKKDKRRKVKRVEPEVEEESMPKYDPLIDENGFLCLSSGIQKLYRQLLERFSRYRVQKLKQKLQMAQVDDHIFELTQLVWQILEKEAAAKLPNFQRISLILSQMPDVISQNLAIRIQRKTIREVTRILWYLGQVQTQSTFKPFSDIAKLTTSSSGLSEPQKRLLKIRGNLFQKHQDRSDSELEKKFPLATRAFELLLGDSMKYLPLLFNTFKLTDTEAKKLDKGLRGQLKINRRVLEKIISCIEVLMLTMSHSKEENAEKISQEISESLYINRAAPEFVDLQEVSQQLLQEIQGASLLQNLNALTVDAEVKIRNILLFVSRSVQLEGSRFEIEKLLSSPGDGSEYSDQQSILIESKIQFMQQICSMHDFEQQIHLQILPKDTTILQVLPHLSHFLKDYSYMLFNMSDLKPLSMLTSNLYKIPKLCSTLTQQSLLSNNEVLLPSNFLAFPSFFVLLEQIKLKVSFTQKQISHVMSLQEQVKSIERRIEGVEGVEGMMGKRGIFVILNGVLEDVIQNCEIGQIGKVQGLEKGEEVLMALKVMEKRDEGRKSDFGIHAHKEFIERNFGIKICDKPKENNFDEMSSYLTNAFTFIDQDNQPKSIDIDPQILSSYIEKLTFTNLFDGQTKIAFQQARDLAVFADFSLKHLDVLSGNQGYDPTKSRCFGFLNLSVHDTIDSFLRKSEAVEKIKKSSIREHLEIGLSPAQSQLLREKHQSSLYSHLFKKHQNDQDQSFEQSRSNEDPEQSNIQSPNQVNHSFRMNQLGSTRIANDKIDLSKLDVSRIDEAAPEPTNDTQAPFTLFMNKNEDEWANNYEVKLNKEKIEPFTLFKIQKQALSSQLNEVGPKYTSTTETVHTCVPIYNKKMSKDLEETYSMQSQLVVLMRELEMAKLQLDPNYRVA